MKVMEISSIRLCVTNLGVSHNVVNARPRPLFLPTYIRTKKSIFIAFWNKFSLFGLFHLLLFCQLYKFLCDFGIQRFHIETMLTCNFKATLYVFS